MVSSAAPTVAQYLAGLPPDRRAALTRVRKVVRASLPPGYRERMQHGMIGYGIPLSRYPDTYNGQPLCIAALASQKQYMSLYLMGVYGDRELERWFVEAWRQAGKKLDMGKSCVRFKHLDDLPLDVIAQVIGKVSVEALIAKAEAVHGKATPRAKAKPAAQRKPPRRPT